MRGSSPRMTNARFREGEKILVKLALQRARRQASVAALAFASIGRPHPPPRRSEQRGGVARLVVAHRLEQRDIAPLALRRGAPFSFSIRRTVSRSRAVRRLEPTTWRAMIEEEAWPSAQALHLVGEVADQPVLHADVDLTVEPHSLEWAEAEASGMGQAPQPGDIPGELDDFLVVDVVQHGARYRSGPCPSGRPALAAGGTVPI